METKLKKIVISKIQNDYRIVTDDPNNWHLVANRNIAKGEFIIPPGNSPILDVTDIEAVKVILEETQESKLVYSSISAVPNGGDCRQNVLEIPWCFMNHSCNPNTNDIWSREFPKDLNLAETAAMKDITEGEELTYDYTLEQYEYPKVDCYCEEQICRGYLGGFKNLSSGEKKRKLSQASPFVQERYRKEFLQKYIEIGPRGRHLIVDYWGCDRDILNDEDELRELLKKAAIEAGAKVMSSHSHKFEGEGVTAVAILAESHISIHTWPEISFAGVDVYTCGNCNPLLAHKLLSTELSASYSEVEEIKRGASKFEDDKKPFQLELEFSDSYKPENWYLEKNILGSLKENVFQGFAVTEVIVEEETPFQKCLIFENPVYGRMLVLDGIVQLATKDEFIYHEMLVHTVMFSHPNPKRILIVGGGDGGALREVVKHNPDEVVLIDIDEKFVKLASEFLPSLNAGTFDNPKVKLIFNDASEALKEFENRFDVAIVDCNDAVGSSKPLFEKDFYKTLSRSLCENSVSSIQAGPLFEYEFLKQTANRLESEFSSIGNFKFTVPSYHCGEYLVFLAANNLELDNHSIDELKQLQKERKVISTYWSPSIHLASQVLPPHLSFLTNLENE